MKEADEVTDRPSSGDPSAPLTGAAPKELSGNPRFDARHISDPQLLSEEIIALAGAIRTPMFVVRDNGAEVFANRAARSLYRTPPAWVGAVSQGMSSLPAGVQRHDVVVVGKRILVVLMVDPKSAPPPPEEAWVAVWALGPRLAEVARRITAGQSDKEIAAEVGVTLATVRTYVKRIYAAAGVHGRVQLLAAALKCGR